MKFKLGKRKHSLGVIITKYLNGTLKAIIANFLFLKVLRLRKKKRIALVGHRLNGNLKAFYDYLQKSQKNYEIVFLTDDYKYYKKQKDSEKPIYSLQKLKHLKLAATSQVICTSHGPLFLEFWAKSKRRPFFVDFWHGAGFKNRTQDDNKPLKFYDALCVPSEQYRKFHKEWGFNDEQLFVTGYGQVDKLVKTPSKKEQNKIKSDFGLDKNRKVVLYAPTWNTKDTSKLAPFSDSLERMFSELSKTAKNNKAQLLVLPHINASLRLNKKINNLQIVSGTGDLDIKPLLHVVDVLITDWSSIYTDFLALPQKKPVIFLDTPPTFFGYTLRPEDRAGYLVKDDRGLIRAVERALDKPAAYINEYSDSIDSATKKVWGKTLDGKSCERYFSVLKELRNEDSQ